MSVTKKIELQPIGFVKTAAIGDEVRDRSNISDIILSKDLVGGLDGIKGFSHLLILFWMHKISREERSMMRVHPRGREDLPLIGVFATRSAYHPNPIGLTLVQLVEVQGNILSVRGLDALDGTPILDVKPFDYWDMTEDAKVPEWWMKLEKDNSSKKKTG